MPYTTKGVSGWKSTGNPLFDALAIMSLAPTPVGMASEEEEMAQVLKDLFGGGKDKDLTAEVENILKVDPKAAKGANIPSDAAERARMIKEFQAKQQASPVPTAPPSISTPTSVAAPSLPALEPKMEMTGEKALKKLGSKVKKGAPVPTEKAKYYEGLNQRKYEQFANAAEEGTRKGLVDDVSKIRNIYKHLKTVFPDKPGQRELYGWDARIKDLDEIEKNHLSREGWPPAEDENARRARRAMFDIIGTKLREAQDLMAQLESKKR